MTPELRGAIEAALERSRRMGTIGGDFEEQLAHCASFSRVLTELGLYEDEHGTGPHLVDLGTGGGVPGLVVAALLPASRWTLVEVRAARATEVERAVLGLGMADRVEVATTTAQELAHGDRRERADAVVARAFGPAAITAECGSGLVRVGGSVVVSEPPEIDDRRWPEQGLEALGLTLQHRQVIDGSSFVVLKKVTPLADAFPRLPPRHNRPWPCFT